MKHTQTIAMARRLLAEGRALDVARMLEPLVEPVPEQVPDALDAGQGVLRALLARVRLLRYGDPVQARTLLKPFDAPTILEALEPAARAEVALWLGWMHTWPTTPTYDAARALYLLSEAKRLFQAMNAAGQRWALLGKAQAYFGLNDFPLMLRAVEEADALQEQGDDAQAALWMLDFRTQGTHIRGCYEQALTAADALKEQARRLDDPFAQGRAYAYQAALYYDLGRPPRAIVAAAQEAETRLPYAAVKPGYALLDAFQAHVGAEIRRGAWDQADHLIGAALQATRDQPTAAAPLLLQRVHLDLGRSRLAEAEAQLHSLDAQIHPLQHRMLAARAALARAGLLEQQGRPIQAREWAARAYAAARESGHDGEQLQTLLTLARLSKEDEEATHRTLSLMQPLSDAFSVLPMVALRFSVLGTLALAEDNPEEARSSFAQALRAYNLIGDVYHAAQIQVKLAALEQTRRPVYTRAQLEAARLTFDRLRAHADREQADALLNAWSTDAEPIAEPNETAVGAALARAALSVDLIAETWLEAARRLLPERWLGIYRCDEGHPWTCVREFGEAPTVPTTHEPCGPQLFADDILWLRLRGHPGPAFFFGVALRHREEPAWQEARARITSWMPVASLALEHALLRAERLESTPLPHETPPLPLQDFVYASPAMRALVEQLHRIRASHSPVLITGERGVGKGLLARAVHVLSPRKSGPFQSVSCTNVTDALSATALSRALVAADGGTLYLAAVDALLLDAQKKLLHFLQQGVLLPPGGDAPMPADVRLVASTTQDLNALIHDGRFLDDLYYRLTTISLAVPPLRERREDIPKLVRHYLNALRPPGTPLPTLTHRAAEALAQYGWPGNIRQLRNEVERILLFAGSEPAPLIDVTDLSPAIAENQATTDGRAPSAWLETAQEAILQPGHALDQVLADTERILIERVLTEHDGQVTASAQALRLTRQGLYKKMKRLGIDASRFHADSEDS